MYVVQFSEDPAADAAHAIVTIVDGGTFDASDEDYIEAIRAGLASNERLGKVIASGPMRSRRGCASSNRGTITTVGAERG